jgi:mannosyltransferase OCH1-like enzyme
MSNIPKLIHYVWIGGKPLPQRFKKNVQSWIKLNPGFEFILWNEDNIDFSQDILRVAYKQKKWSMISDYVRVSVINQYGGIYLDTDVFAIKSFEPLLQSSCFLGYQEDRYINVAVFGATPNHWLISRVHQYYLSLPPLEDDAKIDYAIAFGPDIFNNILKEEKLLQSTDEIVETKDVTIFPRRYFYPYNWNEEFSDSCITPDTISIHFWELSWHLEDKSWLQRKIIPVLKSYPSLYRKIKSIFKRF